MKTSIWLPASSAMVLILSACSNTGTPGAETGPFDAQGRYHEEWADDPSKWRKPGARSNTPVEEPPVVAKNDQPPPNSTPLSTSSRTTEANNTPRETKSRHTGEIEVASRGKSSTKSKHSASSDEPKHSSTKSSTAHTTKPKPKSSSSVRHTVKPGDSLSSIASKYGTSVSAIQKANGIKGTLIRDGSKLTIPKH